MKTRLGRQESQLLAYSQMRGLKAVRTGDLQEPLRLSADQERELFRRAKRSGLIARVRPGLYLVPPRLPLGLRWTPTQAEALDALMQDCQGQYQLCGPSAFNRYGFDDQIPNRLYAYNNRISGERKIGTVEITLIKVADERLGDIESVAGAEGPPLIYSSRARTLVDAVYDWSRFDGLPRGFRWIRKELAAERVRPAALINAALQYGDMGTIRRIGVVLEQIGVAQRLLRQLQSKLPPTSCPIPLDPTQPKRGSANRCWGVILNESSPPGH